MEEIIKITEKDGKRAVNARELHQFLESKQDFSNWIKSRIEKYGFVENQDYCSFYKIIEREVGATKRIEYALSVDMEGSFQWSRTTRKVAWPASTSLNARR